MSVYGKAVCGQTLYGADKWKFDRTLQDLIEEKECAYINYWDLNRVETRMKELAEKFGVSITVKTDWKKQVAASDLSNFPTADKMERIIKNLKTLILAGISEGIETTVSAPESFENADIQMMNNLERILYELWRESNGV